MHHINKYELQETRKYFSFYNLADNSFFNHFIWP